MTKTYGVHEFELAHNEREWRITAVRRDGAPVEVPRALWLRDANIDELYRLACDRVDRAERLGETVRYYHDRNPDYFGPYAFCMVRDGDGWRVDVIESVGCIDWENQSYILANVPFSARDYEKVRALRAPDPDTLHRMASEVLYHWLRDECNKFIPPFRLPEDVTHRVLETIHLDWEGRAFDYKAFVTPKPGLEHLDANDVFPVVDIEAYVSGMSEDDARHTRVRVFLDNLERKLGRCTEEAWGRPPKSRHEMMPIRTDGANLKKEVQKQLIGDVAQQITTYYRSFGLNEPDVDDYRRVDREYADRAPRKERQDVRPAEIIKIVEDDGRQFETVWDGRGNLTGDYPRKPAFKLGPEPEPEPDRDAERAIASMNRRYQREVLVPVLRELFGQTIDGTAQYGAKPWAFPTFAPFFWRKTDDEILSILPQGALTLVVSAS